MPIPRRRIATAIAGAATLLAAGAAVALAPSAFAANEPVNVYLTTTSDSGGRTVTRSGLCGGRTVTRSGGTAPDRPRSPAHADEPRSPLAGYGEGAPSRPAPPRQDR